jgi:hypothetical protein
MENGVDHVFRVRNDGMHFNNAGSPRCHGDHSGQAKQSRKMLPLNDVRAHNCLNKRGLTDSQAAALGF